jgi:hypothetical protein
MYELNRRAERGHCVKCGAVTVDETSERIHTALGVPLQRRIYETSTCTSCRWWRGRAIKRPDYPRTPGARSLIWLSWLLVVGAALAWIPYKLQRDRTVAGYAAAPRAGDLWEVDLGDWPDSDETGYTRVRVITVTAGEVVAAMCGYRYENSRGTSQCESFPLQMDPLSRAEISALYANDAIETIRRDGDRETLLIYGGVWFVAVLGLFVVHARRARRLLG